ncbi:hypothetical protein ACGFX8_37250 [Streptomyces sp. NPDC048362]|uniref:hypothetical protein n=1 Tax=Streptomyces sp. NPDC048362 TaxID=3365539 RepID=UPI0037173C37
MAGEDPSSESNEKPLPDVASAYRLRSWQMKSEDWDQLCEHVYIFEEDDRQWVGPERAVQDMHEELLRYQSRGTWLQISWYFRKKDGEGTAHASAAYRASDTIEHYDAENLLFAEAQGGEGGSQGVCDAFLHNLLEGTDYQDAELVGLEARVVPPNFSQ